MWWQTTSLPFHKVILQISFIIVDWTIMRSQLTYSIWLHFISKHIPPGNLTFTSWGHWCWSPFVFLLFPSSPLLFYPLYDQILFQTLQGKVSIKSCLCCKHTYREAECLISFCLGFAQQAFVAGELQGCLLWGAGDSSPMSKRTNSNQLQDGPAAGRGQAHQWQWQCLWNKRFKKCIGGVNLDYRICSQREGNLAASLVSNIFDIWAWNLQFLSLSDS